MTLLNETGLLHGYSFNSWSDMVTYDEAFIEEWRIAPTSLYYSLQVMGMLKINLVRTLLLMRRTLIRILHLLFMTKAQNLDMTVKNESLRETTESKKKMDSGPDNCGTASRSGEAIHRALALRHMELPVGDFITDALSTDVPDNARNVHCPMSRTENHDIALGYIANAYGVDEKAEAEALRLKAA